MLIDHLLSRMILQVLDDLPHEFLQGFCLLINASHKKVPLISFDLGIYDLWTQEKLESGKQSPQKLYMQKRWTSQSEK